MENYTIKQTKFSPESIADSTLASAALYSLPPIPNSQPASEFHEISSLLIRSWASAFLYRHPVYHAQFHCSLVTCDHVRFGHDPIHGVTVKKGQHQGQNLLYDAADKCFVWLTCFVSFSNSKICNVREDSFKADSFSRASSWSIPVFVLNLCEDWNLVSACNKK